MRVCIVCVDTKMFALKSMMIDSWQFQPTDFPILVFEHDTAFRTSPWNGSFTNKYSTFQLILVLTDKNYISFMS